MVSRLCLSDLPANGLIDDLHAFPEAEKAFDLFGGFVRIGIGPGRILVHFPGYLYVVVVCHALPRAVILIAALFKVFHPYRIGWEIVIVFQEDRVITLGKHGVIPDCLLLACFSSLTISVLPMWLY